MPKDVAAIRKANKRRFLHRRQRRFIKKHGFAAYIRKRFLK